MPGCNTEFQNRIVREARRHMSTYEDMAELIRLGAYRRGTDPAVDQAIQLYPEIEKFLGQQRGEQSDLASGYAQLAAILNMVDDTPAPAEPASEVADG
jgi:flagellum-specific ATP synthase